MYSKTSPPASPGYGGGEPATTEQLLDSVWGPVAVKPVRHAHWQVDDGHWVAGEILGVQHQKIAGFTLGVIDKAENEALRPRPT